MNPNVLSRTEWALSAGFAGSEKVRERYLADLQRITAASGGSGILVPEETLAAAFARKREFVPITLDSSPAATIVRMSVLPARIADALTFAQNAAEANSLRWAALARGLGIIYFALLPTGLNDQGRQRIQNATNSIHDACAKLGGQSTIPWCPTPWKTSLKVWGPENPSFPQMRKIKNVFDPRGVLSPGRFVGGL